MQSDMAATLVFFLSFFCEAARCQLNSGVRIVLDGRAVHALFYHRLECHFHVLLECNLGFMFNAFAHSLAATSFLSHTVPP